MAKRLRIAHVVGNLETGGTQTLLIEIMKRLDRSRFDPFLIYFKEPNHFEREVQEGDWECHKVRASRSYRVKESRLLAAMLRQWGAEVVHTHSDFANFAGRAAAVHASVPYVVAHYQNTYEHRMGEGFRRLEAILAPHTDAFIACSEGVEEYIGRELDLAGRPISMLPNSVDLKPCREAGENREGCRRKLGVPDDVFHIVHTARLEPHKQPQQLIAAMALPENDLGNWRVTFVGDGSMQQELRETVARLDERVASRIHFAGWSRDIATWLGAADLFCLVSRNEGLPLSLVEAMAAGAPTVAPNIVGPREVIGRNEFGLLVDSSDPREILQAVRRYRHDASLHRATVEKGKVRATDYSVETYIRRLEDFYSGLTERPGLAKSSPVGFVGRHWLLHEVRQAARMQRRLAKRGDT